MLVYIKCFKIVEKLEMNENMTTWDNGWTHGLKLAPTSLGIRPMKKLGEMGQLLNLDNFCSNFFLFWHDQKTLGNQQKCIGHNPKF
jgi:hypothetical protein